MEFERDEKEIDMEADDTVKGLTYDELNAIGLFLPEVNDPCITLQSMLILKNPKNVMLPYRHEVDFDYIPELLADIDFIYPILQLYLFQSRTKILPFKTSPTKLYLAVILNHYDKQNNLGFMFKDFSGEQMKNGYVLKKNNEKVYYNPEYNPGQKVVDKYVKKYKKLMHNMYKLAFSNDTCKKEKTIKKLKKLYASISDEGKPLIYSNYLPDYFYELLDLKPRNKMLCAEEIDFYDKFNKCDSDLELCKLLNKSYGHFLTEEYRYHMERIKNDVGDKKTIELILNFFYAKIDELNKNVSVYENSSEHSVNDNNSAIGDNYEIDKSREFLSGKFDEDSMDEGIGETNLKMLKTPMNNGDMILEETGESVDTKEVKSMINNLEKQDLNGKTNEKGGFLSRFKNTFMNK
jgi:hypothetical protein